jgi:hypothetical protein
VIGHRLTDCCLREQVAGYDLQTLVRQLEPCRLAYECGDCVAGV